MRFIATRSGVGIPVADTCTRTNADLHARYLRGVLEDEDVDVERLPECTCAMAELHARGLNFRREKEGGGVSGWCVRHDVGGIENPSKRGRFSIQPLSRAWRSTKTCGVGHRLLAFPT